MLLRLALDSGPLARRINREKAVLESQCGKEFTEALGPVHLRERVDKLEGMAVNRSLQAIGATAIGKQHLVSGNYGKASKALQKALTLAFSIGDTETQGEIHEALGALHHRARRWDQAREHYTAALNIQKARDDAVGRDRTQRNLDGLNQDAGKFGAILGGPAMNMLGRERAMAYRQAAARLVVAGGHPTETVARELNIRERKLRRWVRAESRAQRVSGTTAIDEWSERLLLRNLRRSPLTPRSWIGALNCCFFILSLIPSARTDLAHYHYEEGIRADRGGRLDDAYREYETALGIYTAAGLTSRQAAVHQQLGKLHQNEGSWELATAHLTRALEFHTELGNLMEQALDRQLLGIVHHSVGRWARAEADYQAALDLSISISHSGLEASTRYLFGTLHHVTGRLDRALVEYDAALNILTRLENTGGQAIIRNNLGDLHRHAGRLDDALHQYKETLTLHTQQGNRDEQAKSHIGIGNTQRVLKRIEDAVAHFEAALDLLPNIKIRFEAHTGLGNLYQESGQWKQSGKEFKAALADATQMMDNKGAAQVHTDLAILALQSAKPEEAHRHYEVSQSLYTAQGQLQDAADARVSYAGAIHSTGHATAAEAMELALPAALHLDAVRFQFRTAAERIAWAAKAAHALELVFALAADTGNPDLVADLIDIHLNSTTHTAPKTDTRTMPGEKDSAVRSIGLEAAEAAHTRRPAPFQPDALDNGGPGMFAAGSTSLLASAALPAAPPPPLLAPTNRRPGVRLILDDWKDDIAYPPSRAERPPIRIW